MTDTYDLLSSIPPEYMRAVALAGIAAICVLFFADKSE